MVPTQILISLLEIISDILDLLPLHAFVELTRRLLKSISFLLTGTTRPRAILKTVILLEDEYVSTTHEDRAV